MAAMATAPARYRGLAGAAIARSVKGVGVERLGRSSGESAGTDAGSGMSSGAGRTRRSWAASGWTARQTARR